MGVVVGVDVGRRVDAGGVDKGAFVGKGVGADVGTAVGAFVGLGVELNRKV